MPASSPSPSVAALDEQFNAPDAELILRSSDGVDFAVYKAILLLASHRYNHPRAFCPEPKLSMLEDIKRTASLAHKYAIAFMREAAEKALIRYAQNQPDVAYVVAWRYEFPDALRAAARSSIDAPEFDEVPASALLKLQEYAHSVPGVLDDLIDEDNVGCYIQCRVGHEVLRDLFMEKIMPEDSDMTIEKSCICDNAIGLFGDPNAGVSEQTPMNLFSAPAWWRTYMRTAHPLVCGSDRLSMDDAFSRPLKAAREEAANCPYCRSRDVRYILETTKTVLRVEIERPISEIPIHAPFVC
ncbi:hypothetical protein PENSPDRAFT_669806 [Peniophora sp. CONT]|nr:hypothetical protein PENSPDRAFT_669806 [Peniophora sp. CONT]